MIAQQWHQRYRALKAAEERAMAERFPHFALLEREHDGALAWVGALAPVPGHEFIVRIEYPRHFPNMRPQLYVLWPELVLTPNRKMDGGLCIDRTVWVPFQSTAASLVPLIASWLVVYLDRTLPQGARP